MNKDLMVKENNNIRRTIVKRINEFNKHKRERDNINKIVQDYKEKRLAEVSRMRNIIAELKELNKAKDSIPAEDANELKKIINRKEWFFQINALPIKDEEVIINEIKLLRRRLKSAQEKNNVSRKIQGLISDLEKTRRKHNEFHELVIKKAGESNEQSSLMRVVQKSIKDLKKEGKRVRHSLKKMEEKDKLRISNERNIIKEKQDAVIEKLKKNKKLTTDDLLIFQK
ncbi:hypothetical protein COX58_00415 [archaeon CG_4_10_14_0_2_um_filter_Archaea_38_6]|nr:MAG: hypothetical protein COS83_02760 [archaeon CG07_land_8_20_14_0_80_38_8]PIU88816.1 MAG: hypothetical protein COS64_02445 [archaeon CG06_land_8_20_14_3_00_37_11]PIX44208.1 MAG: hypothetical protein COZ55_00550 [archaeon CG_4_8_14_3_um_filter_38_5]PJA23074.1 MAG: hypothetical protein COX58_00415 [archaeon CG_4_10_14_0_2_um_filter_Archaea_38_6]